MSLGLILGITIPVSIIGNQNYNLIWL